MEDMNRKLIKTLMLLAYSIPYGYLAMYGDAMYGTMLLYVFLILGFGILCLTAIRTDNIITPIIGNILSFISSYLFTLKNLPSKEWAWYFKPLTPISILFIITAVCFVIQILVMFDFIRRGE